MWILFSLMAAFSAACAITLSKAGLKKVEPSVAFAIQSILILLVSWTVVLVQRKLPSLAKIDNGSWKFLIAAGIITCLASLFQFNALKLGNASLVSSIERLSLVFAIVLAVVFLKEQLTWKVMVGAGLMICGALVITLSKSSES